jgi:hypothetical protein
MHERSCLFYIVTVFVVILGLGLAGVFNSNIPVITSVPTSVPTRFPTTLGPTRLPTSTPTLFPTTRSPTSA